MTSRNISEKDHGIILSGNRCIICGWSKMNRSGKTLVIGAHVKPFSNGKESDKRDNIIALCPNHHAEFDAYYFYIDPVKKCAIYQDNYQQPIIGEISHIKIEYFSYRQYLFNKFTDSLSIPERQIK